jgi:hypothetical protein
MIKYVPVEYKMKWLPRAAISFYKGDFPGNNKTIKQECAALFLLSYGILVTFLKNS